MEQQIEIRFLELSFKEKALLVGAVYRQSLIEVGHSADYHVYDLEKSLLTRKKNLAAGRFLTQVVDFYGGLSDFERRIFLCECLEHGRHYAYWWLEYADSKKYYRSYDRLLRKTSASF
jgi:hypothetical protein